MGFIRKVVGDLTGANQAAEATKQNADLQANTTRQAAEATQKATLESAAQAARQQEQAAARAAAEGAAADAVTTPMANPDVQLTAPTGSSASAAARKRRQTFGTGTYNAGVNI